MRSYDLYHTPHPAGKARGGPAVLIKEGIMHYEELKIRELIMQKTTITIHTTIKRLKCQPFIDHLSEEEILSKLFKNLGAVPMTPH